MTIDSLHTRVDRMLSEVGPQPEQPDLAHALFPAFHLFSPEEQARLYVLFDEIEPRVSFYPGGQCNLSKVTDDEIDVFHLYERLYNALVIGNEAEAAKYRQFLQWDRQTLIRNFLSLEQYSDPWYSYTRDKIERGDITFSELDKMREFCARAAQHSR